MHRILKNSTSGVPQFLGIQCTIIPQAGVSEDLVRNMSTNGVYEDPVPNVSTLGISWAIIPQAEFLSSRVHKWEFLRIPCAETLVVELLRILWHFNVPYKVQDF